MNEKFTLNLISFIYNETSKVENGEIISAILSDAKVNESYEELMEAHQLLNLVKRKPRKKTRTQILEFSKNSKEKSIF